jgi:hypothetical protein
MEGYHDGGVGKVVAGVLSMPVDIGLVPVSCNFTRQLVVSQGQSREGQLELKPAFGEELSV